MFTTLLDIAKNFINSPSITRDAGGIFLAKYFQRPDIQKQKSLKNYLEWSLEQINKESSNPLHQCFISGVYKSLVEILKAG